MGYLREAELGPSFPPFATFLEDYGVVPNLFRAQTLLPRIIEAEAKMARAVLVDVHSLTRAQKERIVLAVASARRNMYCVTAHYQMLRLLGVSEQELDQLIADHRRAGLPPPDTELLNFAVKLSLDSPSVTKDDVAGLLACQWNDESVLEAVLTASWADFLCTAATGLGPSPEFAPRQLLPVRDSDTPARHPLPPDIPDTERAGPYLRTVERAAEDFAPFGFFRDEFGFIPNVFRAQTLRPEALEAEAKTIRTVLLTEDHLTRKQKEYILLVVSAVNLNTYFVTVHAEILRTTGFQERIPSRLRPTTARRD
jgi:uncharacterized peroxidase-related enzyme